MIHVEPINNNNIMSKVPVFFNSLKHMDNDFRSSKEKLFMLEYFTSEQVKNLLAIDDTLAFLRLAALYYEKSEKYNKAIQLYATLNDALSISRMLEKYGLWFINNMPTEKVIFYMGFLSTEMINTKPMLLYIKAFTLNVINMDEALLCFKNALDLFQSEDNICMLLRCLISISILYYMKNDKVKAKNLFKCIPSRDSLKRYENYHELSSVLSLCMSAWDDNLSLSISYYNQINLDSLDEDFRWIILAYTSTIYNRLGDLKAGKKNILEALALPIAVNNSMVRGASLIIYCSMQRISAQLDTCSTEINEILFLGENYNFPYFIAYSKNLQAMNMYLMHNVKEALELLSASTICFQSIGNKSMAALNSLYATLWIASQKSHNTLVEKAQDSFNIIKSSPASTWPDTLVISQCILGVVQSEAGLFKQAEFNLLESLKLSNSRKLKQISCNINFHLSKLYYRTLDSEQGEIYLRRAFFTASNNGFYSFFGMHFPTFLELSLRAYNLNICTDYILEMIKKYFGSKAEDYFSSIATIVSQMGISDFVMSFLEQYTQLNNVINIEPIHISVKLFGQFSITVNGIPIGEEEWKTKKEQWLVKYLFLNVDKFITREALIDMFWQRYDKKAAGASLRVALSELRKLMQKYNIASSNNFSLVNEINSSLIIRSSFKVKSDLEDFNALYLRYKQHMKKDFPDFELSGHKYLNFDAHKQEFGELLDDKIKSITKILETIATLYTDNLLSYDLYEDWLEPIRVKYKAYFLDASEVLCLIYIRDNRIIEAEALILRIIDVDYLNEDACLRLIRLYISSGRRSMALHLFNTFQKRFASEMGFAPDQRLKQALRKLE